MSRSSLADPGSADQSPRDRDTAISPLRMMQGESTGGKVVNIVAAANGSDGSAELTLSIVALLVH
jgi:hypothetical protein